MKIGILTYHCVPNFGAQLQTLSTIGFIKKMGHTPVLLNWYPKDLEDLYRRRVSKKQIDCHLSFATNNFPLTQLCRNENQLVRQIEDYNLDMILTGSDALFKYVPYSQRNRQFSIRRFRFVNNYVSSEDIIQNPFFCDYYSQLHKKIPVVAFSVSSQNCPYYLINEEERCLMKTHLSNFQSITVRDSWTKNMVESILGSANIKITPDPVFSFNANNYLKVLSKQEITEKYNLPQHYVLITFSQGQVSSDYIQNICSILKRHQITPVAFPEPEGLIDFGLTNVIQLPLSPIDWYSLIVHSDGYIGTRMHPIIVCLHNAIPFYSFDGNGIKDHLGGTFNQKSSKVYDILLQAGFDKNTYALKSDSQLPSAHEVAHSLLDFDKAKCFSFAKKMQDMYVDEMKVLLKFINQ